MKPFALLLFSALILIASGCSRSAAHDEPAHEHDHAAATYKEGRGIQLSPAATRAVGLVTAEVTLRRLGGSDETPSIPSAALLRTIKGDFVYVANGEWYLRTPVTAGPADASHVAITDGLYEGDAVVTEGVRLLWLAELQAINGGVGCADDN